MCVVNKYFELIEFGFTSFYVGLGVGSWPSNRTNAVWPPMNSIILKNVEYIFTWH